MSTLNPDQPTKPDHRLRSFMYKRANRELEEEFRQHYLADDILLLTNVLFIAVAFMLGLSVLDLTRIDEQPALTGGLTIRLVFILVGVAFILLLRRFRRPAVIDVCAVLYSTLIAVGVLLFHFTTDTSILRIAIIVTFFIFAINMAFPTYSAYTLIPVIVLVSGDSYLLFTSEQPDFVEHRVVVLMVFVTAEIFAVMSSAHLQRSRFHAFEAWRRVRTLSGMLPICANCKKIRDDQGFYQQIETYISSHSEAEFSHSICPECLDELYPDVST